MWLEQGRIRRTGSIEEVADAYRAGSRHAVAEVPAAS
jgi:ABC-type polysaccharide/polyol phosphate transport system ATPase subunit